MNSLEPGLIESFYNLEILITSRFLHELSHSKFNPEDGRVVTFEIEVTTY